MTVAFRQFYALRLLALAVPFALTLLSAEPALAACTAVGGGPIADGSVVICTGTETNTVGTGAEFDVTVDVRPGASIIQGDDGLGILLDSRNRITNFGTIRVGDGPAFAAGIAFFDDNIVINNGTIIGGNSTAGGGPVYGIGAPNGVNNVIINNGTITVGDGDGATLPNQQTTFGIAVGNLNTVTNNGTINGGNHSVGIFVCCDNTATNSASGSIIVGNGSIGLHASDRNVILNAGSITAGNSDDVNSLAAIGIDVLLDNQVTNTGTIVVGNGENATFTLGIRLADNTNIVSNSGSIIVGNRGIGIGSDFLNPTDGNTITNEAGGLIQGGNESFGINVFDAGTTHTVVNNGTIIVGNADNSASAGIAIDGGSVTNTGIIIAGNGPGTAIRSYGILAQGDSVVVASSGLIQVGNDATGILLTGNNGQIENSGLIRAGTSSTGIEINGATGTAVTNSGTIVVGAGGIGVNFSSASGTLNNTGVIRANGLNGVSVNSCAACVIVVTVNNSGTLDGQVFLDAGSTLTNSGLITITDSDAVRAVGEVHIASENFVQTAGGTLALRVTSDGRKDSLGNTGAAAMTLAGTLRALVQPGLYGATTTYTNVVTSGTNINGQFDAAASSSPFFTATASYPTLDAVDLTLARIPFNTVPGLTPNQQTVANALEPNYATTLTGNAATFFGNLLAATSTAVLDQLSGEGLSGMQHVGFGAAGQFNNGMMQQSQGGGGTAVTFPPLGYAAPPARARVPEAFAALDAYAAVPAGRTRLWTSAFGVNRTVDGEPNPGNATQSQRMFGGMFGIDRQFTPDLLAGFAVGGSNATFSSGTTSGDATGAHIGGYVQQYWGSAYLSASASYAHLFVNTRRTITGIGPTENATANPGADILAGRIEAGWKLRSGGYAITPFVALEPAVLWQQGYDETSVAAATGAPGVLGLRVGSQTVSSLPLFLGMQLDTTAPLAGGATLAPFVRASWVHEFLSNRPLAAALLAVPAAVFTVQGASAVRDAARIDGGARLTLANGAILGASVTAELSDRSRSYAGTASLRFNW